MSNSNFITGYCTNIHPGTSFATIIDNLDQYAAPLRELVRGDSTLGVGLWIPNEAVEELNHDGSVVYRLQDAMEAAGLRAYTFNGFPFGNFHQPVVKHRVYEPTWWEESRRDYTWNLVRILDVLLPPGDVGSISTLPIGWGKISTEQQAKSAEHLLAISRRLAELEAVKGRRIVIAIEPEPGCHFDRATDLVEFFDRYIPLEDRRYLTVCHDVCHAAVMNEPQADVLALYHVNQMVVGKFQISSAISVDWNQMTEDQRRAALTQLGGFAEDRYLHQTGRIGADGSFVLAEDLPQLLATCGEADQITDQCWRIHFHVPIFLDQFGALRGTRHDIELCLQTLRDLPVEAYIPHLEIETYAWGVLPAAMRADGLVDSIAGEFHWLDNYLSTQHETNANHINGDHTGDVTT